MYCGGQHFPYPCLCQGCTNGKGVTCTSKCTPVSLCAVLALVRYHCETEQVLSQILIIFDKIPFGHHGIGLTAPVPGFRSLSRYVIATSLTQTSPWGMGWPGPPARHWADQGWWHITRLPAPPTGRFTAAEAQWRGVTTTTLIPLKHS